MKAQESAPDAGKNMTAEYDVMDRPIAETNPNEKRERKLMSVAGPWLAIAACIVIGIYLGGGAISPIGVVVVAVIAAIGLLLRTAGGRMGEALHNATRKWGDP